MTVQRGEPLSATSRKEIAYYVAVFSIISAVGITAGFLLTPMVGVAVFVALGNLLLPKPAPFWHRRR